MAGKWLELLKQIAPKISRVAFMSHPDNPGPRQTFASVKAAAPSLSVDAFETPVEGPAAIEAAMARFGRDAGTAVIFPPDGFLVDQRDLVIELAARYQLPAIYGLRSYVTHGGLASYGVDLVEHGLRRKLIHLTSERLPAFFNGFVRRGRVRFNVAAGEGGDVFCGRVFRVFRAGAGEDHLLLQG